MSFDSKAEVERLRQQSAIDRTHRYAPSRLDRYKGELLQMHLDGARAVDLQTWLREHRIKVAHSTVARWLAKHGSMAVLQWRPFAPPPAGRPMS